jgi:gamma-glutamyltranspeptidase/glutathione hydrolase
VQAAVAAGHPATVEAGIEVLAAGGSAADAAVAASIASCVAETVMTGLLGGGHAIHYEAATGRARNLDCFVAMPGLGAEPGRRAELLELEVPFGRELVHYAVGVASCGVPGLSAGLGALHAEHGRLPWARLVESALRLARDGVDFLPAHAACLAMLEPARRSTHRQASSCGPVGACDSRGSCGRSNCWQTRGRGARTTARWPRRCST